MDFHLAVHRKHAELVATARLAVAESMIDAWLRCRMRGVKPEEPDFVASLVIEGTRLLERYWTSDLRPAGIRVAVAGVYCHQTPKVRYKDMNKDSCELGDILCCHIHHDGRGGISRNALLLQAKMGTRQPLRLRRAERDQLTLYTSWPDFEYVLPDWLARQRRRVTPSAPRTGAQYLRLDSRQPEDLLPAILGDSGVCLAGVCVPADQLLDHADLGRELVGTLELLTGSPFDDRKTAEHETGWSRVVWDLLLASAAKVFSRRRSGRVGAQRTVGASAEELDGAYYINDALPPKFLVQLLDTDLPEASEGVSLLLAETSEPEESEAVHDSRPRDD